MPDDHPSNEHGQPAAFDPSRRTIKDARPRPPTPDDLSGMFPRLEIVELLGQGGMGYVYKARQRNLDRIVALKLLPDEVSHEQSFAERFAREARALARLNHPAIVTVHDSGNVGGLYYFVMEYVDGLNLRELLNRSDGRLEAAKALQIVGSVCDALEYAHDEGVIHRDIKPENILMDRKGRVKIADFGLAKLLSGQGADRTSAAALTLPQQRMGTPHYMAPEQTEHPTEVDHRADIYSVGVVFYEMLTGELPLGRFPLPSELGRGDDVLDDIVLRALAKSPLSRFQAASEIKTAVDSALSGAGAIEPGPAPAAFTTPLPTPAITPVATPGSLPTPAGAPEPIDLETAISRIGSSLDNAVDLRRAFQRVKAPGNWLLACGIVSLILLSPTGVVMILGGIKMKRLEWRLVSILACVMACVPLHTCFPFSIPFGIWGLWVLTRLEVAAAFDIVAAAQATRLSAP